MKYSRSEDYVFNEVDGEMVMMNIETGAYASLNETGKSIWNLLEEPKSVEELLPLLLEEYDIPEATAKQDLDTFVAKLVEQKIIVLNS